MARSALTRTDTLLRVVSPEGDGYRTALALVSSPVTRTPPLAP